MYQRVLLVGLLASTPAFSYFPTPRSQGLRRPIGRPIAPTKRLVATFRLYTEHRFRSFKGIVKATELHVVRCFGKNAERMKASKSSLLKGRMLVIDGTVRYRKVIDPVSNAIYRVAEIYASDFQLMGKAEDHNDLVAVEPSEYSWLEAEQDYESE